MRIALSLIVGWFLSGCSTNNAPFNPKIGDPAYTDWVHHALNNPNESPAYRKFFDAYHGDRAALIAYFQDALEMCETPLINAEGGEGLSYDLQTLLIHLGDKRFSDTLKSCPARTQSATGDFLSRDILQRYPKTKFILKQAPDIDFPLDRAYRSS